jgi:hypothetical protein
VAGPATTAVLHQPGRSGCGQRHRHAAGPSLGKGVRGGGGRAGRQRRKDEQDGGRQAGPTANRHPEVQIAWVEQSLYRNQSVELFQMSVNVEYDFGNSRSLTWGKKRKYNKVFKQKRKVQYNRFLSLKILPKNVTLNSINTKWRSVMSLGW